VVSTYIPSTKFACRADVFVVLMLRELSYNLTVATQKMDLSSETIVLVQSNNLLMCRSCQASGSAAHPLNNTPQPEDSVME